MEIADRTFRVALTLKLCRVVQIDKGYLEEVLKEVIEDNLETAHVVRVDAVEVTHGTGANRTQEDSRSA